MDVQLTDSTTLNVLINTINTGIISSSANAFNISFVTGDANGRNAFAEPIYTLSLPSMASAGKQALSFAWKLDPSFAGYLYGYVSDVVKNTELNQIMVPVLVPHVANAAYSGRVVNSSTVIDVTAQITNPAPIVCGNVTVPVSLYTVNPKSGALVLLMSNNVIVEGNTGVAQIKFSVSEFDVLGSFAIISSVAGTTGVEYSTSVGTRIYLLY